MRLTKYILSVILCFTVALALASCDALTTMNCQHVDVNDDSKCDLCSTDFNDGYDCQHRDSDDDKLCDMCQIVFADGIECYHWDDDFDGYCDVCKRPTGIVPCQHRDADDNCICDYCDLNYTDGQDLPDTQECQHQDEDGDSLCDKCKSEYTNDNLPDNDVHSHTFGEWIKYGYEDGVTCDKQLFYQICSECSAIEWKNGGYENHTFDCLVIPPTCTVQGYTQNTCTACGLTETVDFVEASGHSYNTIYSYSNSFHWLNCQYCDEKASYSEHNIGENGLCTYCGQPSAPTEGLEYRISADGQYAEVVGYSGLSLNIFIANEYNGVPVTTIGEQAFYASAITSVTLPENITTIKTKAFSTCLSLSSIVIPNNITSIENLAFANCAPSLYTEYGNCKYIGTEENPYMALVATTSNAMSSYTIHNNTKVIADGAFISCNLLTDISIPDSVARIGKEVFYKCRNLKNVTIGSGVTTIAHQAFKYCESLTRIEIPNNVVHIEKYAFQSCTSLKSVVLGTGVSKIGEDAFYGCTSLNAIYISDISRWCQIDFDNSYSNPVTLAGKMYLSNALLTNLIIPETVSQIKQYAFFNCDSIRYVSFNESLEKIGNSAFYECDEISSVTIPDGVSTIENYAFYGCDDLSSVIIGRNVLCIGYRAFYLCNNLINVAFRNIYGWYITPNNQSATKENIDSSKLSVTTNAARFLRDTYNTYCWYRY